MLVGYVVKFPKKESLGQYLPEILPQVQLTKKICKVAIQGLNIGQEDISCKHEKKNHVSAARLPGWARWKGQNKIFLNIYILIVERAD